MRIDRFQPWAEQVIAQSPAIGGVEPGIEGKPAGTRITLATGAQIHIQWVRTSPPTGDKFAEPESPVIGQPAEPVKVPELPTSGRIRTADVEQYLAALLINGGHEEVAEVTGYSAISDRKDREQRYGLRVRAHSGATIYGLFLHTLSSGRQPGHEFDQQDEV